MRYKFRYVAKTGKLELEWEERVSNREDYRERRVITEVYELSERQERLIKALSDNEAHNIRVIASRVYGKVNYVTMSEVKLLIAMVNSKIEGSRIKGLGKGLKAMKVIRNEGRKQI